MIRDIVRYLRIALRQLAWFVICAYLCAKHWLLAPYYRGLAVQARYRYRTSELFKLRWQALGYDYAVESFAGDTGIHFFFLAKKEPLRIRSQIFLDATLGREPRPYYVDDEGGR